MRDTGRWIRSEWKGLLCHSEGEMGEFREGENSFEGIIGNGSIVFEDEMSDGTRDIIGLNMICRSVNSEVGEMRGDH